MTADFDVNSSAAKHCAKSIDWLRKLRPAILTVSATTKNANSQMTGLFAVILFQMHIVTRTGSAIAPV